MRKKAGQRSAFFMCHPYCAAADPVRICGSDGSVQRTSDAMLAQYLPILIFLAVAGALGVLLLVLGYLFAPRVPDAAKLCFAGLIASQAKSASRLKSFISGLFDVDVEVDEFSAVVFALSDSDREADLPYRGGRTISDS